MGTRGLLGFIAVASRLHAIYSRSDSSPDGLGREVIAFILGLQKGDYTGMSARLRKVSWVPEQANDNEWPQVWDMIWDIKMGAMEGRKVEDSIDFLDNTIFCEWEYFVDVRRTGTCGRQNLQRAGNACGFMVAGISETLEFEVKNGGQ